MSELERWTSLPVAPGELLLWWLGQSGFLIRSRASIVLIDPFLASRSDRLTPPAFAPDELKRLDAILVTHEHGDHLDEATLPSLAECGTPEVIAPAPLSQRLRSLGIAESQIRPIQPGDPLEIAGGTVTALPAFHGVQVADAYGDGRDSSAGQVRFLGYLLDLEGVRVYHAGDTIAFAGLAEEVRRLGAQLALLPINGRNFYREQAGVVGNLTAEEAAELALRAGVEAVVPMHHDMFPNNLGNPADLVALLVARRSPLAVLVPTTARPFRFSPLERLALVPSSTPGRPDQWR